MYIVYKTTNLVNGKFYIGVHKLNNTKYDYYLGSGKLLKQAIKKYGRKNFKRETLKKFSNDTDAYNYEKEVVNEEIIGNPLCYNITNGGGNPPTFYGSDHHLFGVGHSEEAKQKMRDNHADFSGEKHPLFGTKRSHSEETKQKMSISRTGKKRVFSEKHKLNLSNAGKMYYQRKREGL